MLNNLIGGLLGPNTQRQGPHGPMHFVQVHGNTAINIGDYAWGPSGLDAIITQVIVFKRKFCFFKINFPSIKLLNQLETSGPAPATEAQIAALASEIITNDHLG
jgi:E3 ubiquitin-protein ligase RNF115/126